MIDAAESSAPAIDGEQAADFARLMRAAGEPDADQAAQDAADQAQQDQQAAQAIDQNSEGVAMFLGLAVPFLGQLFPSIPGIYTDQAQAAMAMTLGPVLTKYGISLGDLGGAYKEEIAAVLVCGPIAWATYKGIMADIAARAAPVPKAVAGNERQGAPAERETVTLG